MLEKNGIRKCFEFLSGKRIIRKPVFSSMQQCVHGAVYGKIDPQWTQKVQGYCRSLRFKHIECVFPSMPFVVDSSSNLEFEPIEFIVKILQTRLIGKLI